MFAESGAIIDSVLRRHGQGRLAPAPDSAEYDAYVHWLHSVAGPSTWAARASADHGVSWAA